MDIDHQHYLNIKEIYNLYIFFKHYDINNILIRKVKI